jgi:hypothetical protein
MALVTLLACKRINMIAVLFARTDSKYKQLDGYDVYDIDRDARNYCKNYPVLAHPPCRAWGRLSHMANPREGEKQLAYFALAQVRLNGGILEHPAGSRLWEEAPLPLAGEFPDEFGGFTIEIDQYDFGHVAHKQTKLYICGIKMNQLPPMPPKNTAATNRSICGNVAGTKRCTQYQREYTPDNLIDWMTDICRKIKNDS